MTQTSRIATSVATTLLMFVSICARPAGAQGPVLVPQSAGNLESSLGGGGGTVEFGASGKWLATGDGSGILLIFDIESGRIAQNIGTTFPFSELIPHPSKDLVAIFGPQSKYDYLSGEMIALYDVTNGKEMWHKATSSRCTGLHFSADGASLSATCTTSTGMKPKNALVRWDTATGAESPGIELPNGYSSYISSEDGRWITYANIHIFSNPFKKAPKPGDALGQMYDRSSGIIVDTESGQTIGSYPGMIAALSARTHTAVVHSNQGLVLLQIPDMKTIGTFASATPADYRNYTSVKVSRDGTKYILTTTSKVTLIDAATGAAKELPPIELPIAAAAAFSGKTDQVAVSGGGTVTLLEVSKPNERRRLGGSSALPAPNLAAELSENEVIALQSVASNAASAEKKAMPRRINPRAAQDIQAAAATQSATADSIKEQVTQDYVTRMMEYTSKFGAASLFPAIPTFIDNGHLLVLLSADGDWEVWDVATGNRLPYHRSFTFPTGGESTKDMTKVIQADINKIEKDLGLTSGEVFRPIAAHSQSRQDRVAERNALSSRNPKDPIHRVACSLQGQDVTAEITANGKSITSATLHRTDGTTVDLLAKGIDVSTFKPSASRLGLSAITGDNEGGLCTLSPDAHRIVVEVIRPGHSEKKLPFKAGIVSIGINGTYSDSLVIFDLDSGKRVELEREVPDEPFDVSPGELVFSPDGSRLIAGGKQKVEYGGVRDRTIKVWDPRTGKLIRAMKADDAAVAGFSADGRQFFTSLNPLAIDGSGTGIRVWDAVSAQPLYELPDVASSVDALATTTALILGPIRENGLGIWKRQTGERLGTMLPLQEGEWLVTTPSGLFDGSPRGWQQIAWRDNANTFTTQPAEIFFNEFFHPGLLAELLEGKAPTPPRTISQIDRRQPAITLTSAETTTGNRNLPLHITVAEASSSPNGLPAGGVRDVRLFRNGTMIKSWRGDLELKDGKLEFDENVTIVAGDNKFIAYAFNRDNVKSPDAVLAIRGTASPRPAKTYILAVGVNHYANDEFDLRYAAPDADRLAEVLTQSQQAIAPNQHVVKLVLHDDDATKANVTLALDLLSGRHQGPVSPAAPKQLSTLTAVNPEDTVIVYFAGHGLAWRDHFYLVPHDLGYSGPRKDLRESLEQVLHSSISDYELEQAFEPMDAAHLLLIIDACNSGQVLDSEEQRRGPMNSHGLAQLAYEKGMYVLTAAQAYQAALESSRLGHGYLTYALAEEGLTKLADTGPADGLISAEEWFEYASRRVPQLQIEALKSATQNGRQLTFEFDTPKAGGHDAGLQTPRLYYRRELSGPLTIIAKPK